MVPMDIAPSSSGRLSVLAGPCRSASFQWCVCLGSRRSQPGTLQACANWQLAALQPPGVLYHLQGFRLVLPVAPVSRGALPAPLLMPLLPLPLLPFPLPVPAVLPAVPAGAGRARFPWASAQLSSLEFGRFASRWIDSLRWCLTASVIVLHSPLTKLSIHSVRIL